MKADLEPAKAILRTFLSEIDAVKKIQQSISEPILTSFNIKDRTPDLTRLEFEPAPESFWVKDNAYTRSTYNPMPKYYLQPALPLYQHSEAMFNVGCPQSKYMPYAWRKSKGT